MTEGFEVVLSNESKYYLLHSRPDQLASCFIHNVCELLYCKFQNLIPLVLRGQHSHLNTPRWEAEPVSSIYEPFRLLVDEIRPSSLKKIKHIVPSWRHLDQSGISAILCSKQDVISAYQNPFNPLQTPFNPLNSLKFPSTP